MSTLSDTRDSRPGGTFSRAARLGTIRARSRTLITRVVLAALMVSIGRCKVGELTQAPPPNGTAATRLVFTVQPSTTRAQAAITPAVRVAAQDELGNVATGFTGTITLALGSNPAGGTLGGTRTGVATQGVATFPSISLNKPGSGYTLAAAASGLTAAASGAFDVMPGAPGKLALTTAPSPSAQSDVAFAQQPALQLEDSAGNPVPQAGTLVTATIVSGPTGATLKTDTARTNATGVAAFSGLTISGPVGTYTLSFTATGLGAATSGPIGLSAGPASTLAMVTYPTASIQSGVPFPQQPVLQLRDAAGNPVSQGGTAVSAAITSGGGTLSGTNPVPTNASGAASFTNLTITSPPGQRVITFSATGLDPAAATVVVSAAPATQIAAHAGNNQTAAAGSAVAVAPAVIVEDQTGAPVAGVAVSFAVTAGGGSITGANATSNASGIAAVGSWVLGPSLGTNALAATASGLTGSPVQFTATATAGPAAKLVFLTQPSTTAQSGVPFSQQPVLQLEDAAGNPVSQGGMAVTAAIVSGGGTLSGTNPVTTSASGAASFTNLAITGSPGQRTLAFSAAGVSGVSAAVSIAAPPPTQIAAYAGTNQTATAGSAVPVAPAVIVEDQSGAPVAGVAVSFAVTAGGGSITGANATTNASGIAAVGSWTLGPSVGTNTLAASAAGLTGSPVQFTATATVGPSASIAVAAGDAQTATVNTAIATAPAVIVRDRFGNPVPGVAVSFVVALGGGSVTQASPTTGATGIAAVGSWTLGTAAGANTLTASASGVSSSVTFSATGVAGPPSATQSAVSAAPATITASSGSSAATISVTVRDAYGNPVSGASVAIAASGGGNTLTQSSTASNAAGQVSATLSSTVAGTKTIGATASSVTLTATPSVTVTPGPAVQLVFTGQPTDTRANAPITPPVVVAAVDAFGNTAFNYTGVVTVSITSGTGTALAVLSGTTSVSAAGGVASFGNLSIDLPSTLTPYRLNAASSGLGGATSTTFNITP